MGNGTVGTAVAGRRSRGTAVEGARRESVRRPGPVRPAVVRADDGRGDGVGRGVVACSAVAPARAVAARAVPAWSAEPGSLARSAERVGRGAPRLALVPTPSTVVSQVRFRVRRAVAAVLLALVAAVVVAGLGSLADVAAAAQARSTVPAGSAVVAVSAGETVWDVARRTVPGADTGAVVERIAADNGLSADASAQVAPLPAGLALHVPA